MRALDPASDSPRDEPGLASGRAPLSSDPGTRLIVDAVCHVPFGAHPSYAQGYYDRDNAAYMEWEEISRDAERIERYLQEWVSGVDSRETYREKLGAQVRERLTVGSRPSGAVDFGDC